MASEDKGLRPGDRHRRGVIASATAWALALGVTAVGALGASLTSTRAQEALCNDRSAYCGKFLQPACLESFGAGALAVRPSDSQCRGQIKSYGECIASSSDLCAPRAAPVSQSGADPSCSAEDARALWTELRESRFVEDLEGFAEMCAGRPQAMLAANRARRIKQGVVDGGRQPGFSGPPLSAGEIAEAQSHLVRLNLASGDLDGVWSAPWSDALETYQRNAGLPINRDASLESLALLRQEPTPQPKRQAVDLSGQWRGAYFYDYDRTPVAFQLLLTDRGGEIAGRSDEPQTFGSGNVGTLYANWRGKISGDGLLALTKTYDGTGGVNHSIDYTGRLVGPNRIEGRWSIDAANNGLFTLER